MSINTKCSPQACPIVAFSDLTPAEQRAQRAHKAKEMSDRGFSEQQIAKQFGVSQPTISSDLSNLSETDKLKPAKTASNPKGAGRPRGGAKRSKPSPKIDMVQAAVDDLVNAGKPVSRKQLAKQYGVGHHAIQLANAKAQGRLEAELEIAPDTLSMSAQEKLDTAIRQHKKKLDADFHQAVNARVKTWLEETMLPQHRKEQSQAKSIMNARRGVMDKITFNKIRRALHPDSRLSISEKLLAEAFDAFMALEKTLLNEQDSPTEFSNMPTTVAEWDALRARTTADRTAKRRANLVVRR